MELQFNLSIASDYHSPAQIARVLTERWVSENMFCPHCGRTKIQHFSNNRPVADYFCPDCGNEYELKSKNGRLGASIADGAYATMIRRISSNNNPDFFFMSYSKADWTVRDLILIPKYFFWSGIIEKRKPLSPDARRAGWVGCNILLDQIPEQGRIPIIKNGIVCEKDHVLSAVRAGASLMTSNLERRGWLFDVLNCVNRIPKDIFLLEDVYCFESVLSEKHPENHNIRPKIRQQLQVLRDKGLIVFLGNGHYKKIALSRIPTTY